MINYHEPIKVLEKKKIFRISQVIGYIFGLIETFLGLRILLRLAGANPDNPLTRLIYDITHPFAYPFFGLVAHTTTPDGFVFEWSTLIGMLLYVVLAYVVIYLFQLVNPAYRQEVKQAVGHI